MRSRLELWKLISEEFESEVELNDGYECIYICEIINSSEELSEYECDSLLSEMSEFAIKNNLDRCSPFWDKEDLKARRQFIKEKIEYYEGTN